MVPKSFFFYAQEISKNNNLWVIEANLQVVWAETLKLESKKMMKRRRSEMNKKKVQKV